jgi:hypothetical protein
LGPKPKGIFAVFDNQAHSLRGIVMSHSSPYRVASAVASLSCFRPPEWGLAVVLALLGVASLLRILTAIADHASFGAEATINLIICGLLLGRAKDYALSLARRAQDDAG